MAEPTEKLDLEAICRVLESVRNSYGESSEERRAIDVAAIGLTYISWIEKWEAFEQSLRDNERPIEEVIRASHEFATMQEAMDWLERNPRAEVKTLVTIGGLGHI